MNKKTQQAQAITELAILGAIILLLLSVIVTYGLRFNYGQQAAHIAFRRAMAGASGQEGEPSSSVYTLILDKHVPSPQDPHGVGNVVASTAGYSITRSFRLNEHPTNNAELPKYTFGFSRGMAPPQEVPFNAAGFLDFCWEPCNRYAIKHLQTIYGANNVWTEGMPDDCARVVDSCWGDILDYDSCHRQCRMFTDGAFCREQCVMGSITGVQCANKCASGIEPPDYCGALDGMFSFDALNDEPRMGIQGDTIQTSVRGDTMTKTETPGGIATTDRFGSQDIMTRRIVFRSGLGSAVQPVDHVVEIGDDIDMGVSW